MIRLDKMLAHMGYGSRKEVKELIRKGFVLVNGEVITNDDFKVDEINDEVIIADEKVEYKDKVYVMLNTPDGYISATFDNHDPTVIDLIDEYNYLNIFPVGRLDKDTHGLLLITNDGDLAHNLLSPKKHVDKKYYLKFDGNITEKGIKAFEEGIILDDGYKTMPAKLIDLGNNEAHVIIKEGKFHQVKIMMERIGCKVTYLKRIEFGSLKLDEALEEGQYRLLTEEELNNLRK
jgi:16S rRNA pseudouridine516 synthase